MRLLTGLVIGFLILAAGCTPAAELPPSPSPTSADRPATARTATPVPSPTVTPAPSPTRADAWYRPIDPSYGVLAYQYAHVTDPQARMYLTAEGALQASLVNKRFPQADAYVAYARTVTQDGQTLYQLASGEWMRGQDLQDVTPSAFSGLLLDGPADFRFGWVLEAVQSVDAAGDPVRAYARYQVVREDRGEAQKAGYVAVGPGEWLPEKELSLVTPGYRPPAGVDACRFTVVDLARQNLRVYDDCKLVFATLISSGRQFGSTPIGTFTVFQKTASDLITPPYAGGDQYYLQEVPYISFFYGVWAFHGAYWHDRFGFPASHGCINLAPADAGWLFDWLRVGDRVVVLPVN
jgi:hypothetical protein